MNRETPRSPLEGVRIIEIANYLSGPYCGQMLVDLGAEVIKVEQPSGDPFRRFGRPSTHISAFFANCNRGKRSVVLDLKQKACVDVFFELIEDTDVLISNWRPDVAMRLGLDDEKLAVRNTRLIRVYITGYGSSGTLANAPAYDSVVQARSGATRALWSADVPALLPGYPIDKLTAVMATQATLAALYVRQTSGKGERVDVAMLDAAAYLNFVDLLTARTFLKDQTPEARNLHASAVRPIRAADGWFVVAAVSAADIRGACDAVAHPEWADEILALRDQISMAREFTERLESVTSSALVETWLGRLRERDVPAARCSSIDDHLADEQVAHNEIYTIEEWPEIGPVRSPRYPARFASMPDLHAPGPAPALGVDTQKILTRRKAADRSES